MAENKWSNKIPEPQRIEITWEDLPPEEKKELPRQYPGLNSDIIQAGVGVQKGAVITGIGSSQVKQYLLAGLIGGLLAWIITEATFDATSRSGGSWKLLLHIGLWSAMIGAAIGSILGAAEGITGKVSDKAINGGLLGAGVGFVGGFIGGVIAQLVYGSMLQGGGNDIGIRQIVARTIGWAIAGLFIGLAEGISGRNVKKVINGLIGGLIPEFDTCKRKKCLEPLKLKVSRHFVFF